MSIFSDITKNIREISTNVVSEMTLTAKNEPEIIMPTRNQAIVKVLSTVLGIAASFTLTYLGIKWLTDAMDPTKKEKKLAQAEVSILRPSLIL